MASEHTQQPWSYEAEEGFCAKITGADGSAVCFFDQDPSEADARLMTAAPELLAALQYVLDTHACLGYAGEEAAARAQAAISKATGATHD